MKNLQKIGGIAALIGAATNLLAIVMFITLGPKGLGSDDPGQVVAFLADNQAIMRGWYLIIYLVFGVSLIFLSLALYERLKAGSPALVTGSDHLRTDLGRPGHCDGHTLNQRPEHSRQTLWRKSGSSCNGLVDAQLCGNRFGQQRRGNDGERLMVSTAKLGSLAGKGASQGIELPWRGDRCSRHPLGCPSACPGSCLWIGSHHLVSLARDRAAALEPCLRGGKTRHTTTCLTSRLNGNEKNHSIHDRFDGTVSLRSAMGPDT